ncbi:MAG: hypothetical protein H7A23_24550 [Leptospiraceae bacterium]|nr:hypothetical protein [Leptospiraceae bacterium]
MKKISIVFIVLLSFLITININGADEKASKERKNGTVVSADGKVQLIEYTPEQTANLEKLNKDIQFFHDKLNEQIPYIVAEKLAKNGKYERDMDAYLEHNPAKKTQYVVNEYFVLTLADKKVSEIKLIERKANVVANRELETVVRTISNKVNDKPSDGVVLNINVETSGGQFLQGNPADVYTSNNDKPVILPTFLSAGLKEKQTYSMTNIVDPADRIWLVKMYKKTVEKIVRDIDRVIERRTKRKEIYTKKMLKNLGN